MVVNDQNTEVSPLLSLQPVVDSKGRCVALSLHFAPVQEREDVSRLVSDVLNDAQIVALLGQLPLMIRLTAPAKFAPVLDVILPVGRVLLCIPVEHCTNPTYFPVLERLRLQGYVLMADGLPLEGVLLPPYVTALAFDADLLAGNTHSFREHIALMPDACVAENVSDRTQLARAVAAGVRWFAGATLPHLALDTLPAGDVLNKARLLTLLDMVVRDANTMEIEEILKEDPALSYQLLKLVGAASLGVKHEITSLHQAVSILGRRQLQRWLQLLLYVHTSHDGIVSPLFFRVATRAALMESLSQVMGQENTEQDKAFLVGMFSMLDQLLGMPLKEILSPLTLSGDICGALLDRSGLLGNLLRLVESNESRDTSLAPDDLLEFDIQPQDYFHSLIKAYRWAARVSQGVCDDRYAC